MKKEIMTRVDLVSGNRECCVMKALMRKDKSMSKRYFLDRAGRWVESPLGEMIPPTCVLSVTEVVTAKESSRRC